MGGEGLRVVGGGSGEVWEGVRVIKKVKGLGWGRGHIQGPLWAREGKERRGEGKEGEGRGGDILLDNERLDILV